MKKEIINQLTQQGFEGFQTVAQLRESCLCVPTSPGVYLVIRAKEEYPHFLEKGTGGFYNGKNPNESIDYLKANWIEGEPIVYIGQSEDLRSRIKLYMLFGQGENKRHYGGRLIWQLVDAEDLIIAWKPIQGSGTDAERLESEMLEQFKMSHGGRLPFANLKSGKKF